MPVQINEIIIRANVVEQGEGAQKTTEAPAPASGNNIDKAEIIQECVDIILEVLSSKKER